METVTVGQIVTTIGALTAIFAFCDYLIKKWNSMINAKLKTIIDQQASMTKDISMLSDVCYQMLDHMATENNTGGMKKALDQYNEYQRHN